MTFNTKNLSVLSYANGFTLWHMATADSLADIDTSDYLNSASDMVRAKDMIFASASNGTGIFSVASNANGVVDLNNTITSSESNTD